jgi:hypothetical protein
MSSPLQSLRNWLPFGNTKGDLADVDALRAWLDSHQAASITDVASGLANRLPQLLARQNNIHLQLRLVDSFAAVAERILPELEDGVSGAALPLVADARAKALAADNLLKALISGYGTVVAAIESRRWSAGLRHLLQTSLLRTMETIERRQVLAYRAYTCPSPASWQQLHDCYCAALQRNLAGAAKNERSIERVYARALLLTLSDPTKRSRHDLKSLTACIDQLLPWARFGVVQDLSADERKSPALFPLPAGNSRLARPLAVGADAATGDGLMLDTRVLVAELKRHLAEDPAALSCRPELAESLAEMWSRPLPRRFSRSRLKPKADVVAGIAAVAQYLQGALARREDDGRDPVRLSISEWYIVNESPDGFGLRYAKGDAEALDVGDVIGVRPRERSRIHICLVRRVSNAGLGRFELGVQELSPLALPIPIVNGNPDRYQDGILLPRMPAFANAAGLAAPTGLLTANKEIHWHRNGLHFHHRVERRIEGNHRTELFLLA